MTEGEARTIVRTYYDALCGVYALTPSDAIERALDTELDDCARALGLDTAAIDIAAVPGPSSHQVEHALSVLGIERSTEG